jgi:hypothetical protein
MEQMLAQELVCVLVVELELQKELVKALRMGLEWAAE